MEKLPTDIRINPLRLNIMPNDARGDFTEKTTAVLLQYFQENLPALKG